jgi:hypothetical protein
MQSETRGYVCNWHAQWTCMDLLLEISFTNICQFTNYTSTEHISLFQEPDSLGCLLEITWNGQKEISVGNSIRKFLQDGDEVILTACCKVYKTFVYFKSWSIYCILIPSTDFSGRGLQRRIRDLHGEGSASTSMSQDVEWSSILE